MMKIESLHIYWRQSLCWAKSQIDAQQGRTILWAPLFLIIGIWLYFSLHNEPSFARAGGISGLFMLLAVFLRKYRSLCLFIALIGAGFFLAKVRADYIWTPILPQYLGQRTLTGTVYANSRHGDYGRILIVAPDFIEGISSQNLPHRLRLTGTEQQGDPPVGAHIKLQANLMPLPGLVAPDSFDYARLLWFQAIGGSGRILSKITVSEQEIPKTLWIANFLYQIRSTIHDRLLAELGPEIGPFAEAQITGERGQVTQNITKSLQISGLYHIISISGLHMSLVAGGIFWLIRALLALIPALALQWPIKKISAIIALAAGWFYLLLAGSDIATVRSYIMVAIMLFAILVDRPAISMRNLALAAFIVLIFNPEAALSASFQMSFLAVMGLLTLAGLPFFTAPARHFKAQKNHWILIGGRRVWSACVGMVMASLVAGICSSIPAAYHFGRLSPLSILANGLSLPLMSFIVMPMMILSIAAMPLGLQMLPLKLMGIGLEGVLKISDWIATYPSANMQIAQPNLIAILIISLSIMLICLSRGSLKWAGAPLAALGILLNLSHNHADILIENRAANVAFYDQNGLLNFASAQGGKFAADQWLRSNGENLTLAQAAERSGWHCIKNLCTATLKGLKIGFLQASQSSNFTCESYDIIIAQFPLYESCPQARLRLDRFSVWRDGAQSITIRKGAIILETARARAGNRPWVTYPKRQEAKVHNDNK